LDFSLSPDNKPLGSEEVGGHRSGTGPLPVLGNLFKGRSSWFSTELYPPSGKPPVYRGRISHAMIREESKRASSICWFESVR